jgi:hypothetical protein
MIFPTRGLLFYPEGSRVQENVVKIWVIVQKKTISLMVTDVRT